MLSTVLRCKRAIAVNVEIMRTFVRLRQILTSNAEMARRLDELRLKYDQKFKVVFDAIRLLMNPTSVKRKELGFRLQDLKTNEVTFQTIVLKFRQGSSVSDPTRNQDPGPKPARGC